ncbi:MAG: HEAT repeat domain-containing protein, partial [Cyanobacteria bacterium J06573_2]
MSVKSSQDIFAINTFLESLKHHNPRVSSVAVERLIECTPATVQPLIDAFHHSSDQNSQAYIIQALAQIGNP